MPFLHAMQTVSTVFTAYFILGDELTFRVILNIMPKILLNWPFSPAMHRSGEHLGGTGAGAVLQSRGEAPYHRGGIPFMAG